ncbi:MAG: hypothetical protein E6J16_10620 [Chloroflexota bacterium]|nr:MAG: hypothetical protein E6J16_10620 [Chloroflexota bacterium]
MIGLETRSGQAGGVGVGVGDGLGDTVGEGDGVGVGLRVAEPEPHAELAAITNRRMATSRPRCLSDDFSIAWAST